MSFVTFVIHLSYTIVRNNNKNLAIMKKFKNLAIEIIKTKNVKEIKEKIQTLLYVYETGFDSNNTGVEILKMVLRNSNDFTKDIADKFLTKYYDNKCELPEYSDGYRVMMSEKQAWCIAYQIVNNIEVYLIEEKEEVFEEIESEMQTLEFENGETITRENFKMDKIHKYIPNQLKNESYKLRPATELEIQNELRRIHNINEEFNSISEQNEEIDSQNHTIANATNSNQFNYPGIYK